MAIELRAPSLTCRNSTLSSVFSANLLTPVHPTPHSTLYTFSGLLRAFVSLMNAELLAKAKSLGFSDRQIAHLTGRTEDDVRAERKKLGLVPSYRLVDTCAAEFEAYTPYYYSTYDRGDDEVTASRDKRR